MSDRDALLAEARELGLNPHHATGAEKLAAMIAEAKGEAPAEVDTGPAKGFQRLRVRRTGADKITTGKRIEDPIHPHDETFPEGAVIDLPDHLAEIYLAKDWVDPA